MCRDVLCCSNCKPPVRSICRRRCFLKLKWHKNDCWHINCFLNLQNFNLLKLKYLLYDEISSWRQNICYGGGVGVVLFFFHFLHKNNRTETLQSFLPVFSTFLRWPICKFLGISMTHRVTVLNSSNIPWVCSGVSFKWGLPGKHPKEGPINRWLNHHVKGHWLYSKFPSNDKSSLHYL